MPEYIKVEQEHDRGYDPPRFAFHEKIFTFWGRRLKNGFVYMPQLL